MENIRRLIREEQSGAVRIRNYTKDGREFINAFYLMPLKNENGKTVLFFGGQCEDRNLMPDTEATKVAESVHSRLLFRTPGSDYVAPNTGDLAEWSNEFSKGRVLIKTKTNPVDARVADYFAGKNRMFEYQVQFEITQPIPEDHELFIGAEIDGPLQIGYGSRMIVSMILRVLKLFNSSLHHSYGGDGIEQAHLVFPFHVLPDNLSFVEKGDQPPQLTLKELPDVPKVDPEEGLKPGRVYTLSFYSQYIDFGKSLSSLFFFSCP